MADLPIADVVELEQLLAKYAVGMTKDDVDAYYCAGDAPGLGPMSMIDYMGLKVRHVDSTDVGGSSYQVAVGHALAAIATGQEPPKPAKPVKPPAAKKNPHAVALGRKGGKVGGKARAASLTAEERRAIAVKAARARWGMEDEA